MDEIKDQEGASLETEKEEKTQNPVEEVQKSQEELAKEEAQANADLLSFIMHDRYTQSSAPQETKTSMEEETYNLELNRPVPTHKLTRKQRKRDKYREKIRKKYFADKDIKYRGIFSYRYLRLFAWISLAVAQIVILHNYTESAFPVLFKNPVISQIVLNISDASIPLFLLATFAYILNRNTSYQQMIVFYLLSYLGVALLECFVIHRYLMGLFTVMGSERAAVSKLLSLLVGQKLQFNVFSDIFMLILFNFFLNYTPKKLFTGKKLAIFRAFCVIPLLFALGIYIIRLFSVYGKITLSVYAYPFLTTKSPFVYVIFVIISLWIKNRERIFKRFGATQAEYNKFLRTNRNSLSFSLEVSLLFFIFSIIDAIAMIIAMSVFEFKGYPPESVQGMATALGFGQCAGLMVAIPVVLLFSYTRKENNPQLDTMLPFIGIAMILLVYIEGCYDIVIDYLRTIRDFFAS